jgi:hypothetical protein
MFVFNLRFGCHSREPRNLIALIGLSLLTKLHRTLWSALMLSSCLCPRLSLFLRFHLSVQRELYIYFAPDVVILGRLEKGWTDSGTGVRKTILIRTYMQGTIWHF